MDYRVAGIDLCYVRLGCEVLLVGYYAGRLLRTEMRPVHDRMYNEIRAPTYSKWTH